MAPPVGAEILVGRQVEHLAENIGRLAVGDFGMDMVSKNKKGPTLPSG